MKLIPFLMPGFPSIGASRDVVRFLQSQPDVIIETALPALSPSGSALVQKVRKIVNRAGIRAQDVMATFRADRKRMQAMLMLHAEPDGHQFSQIITAFDYAIAPFDPKTVAKLNQTASNKDQNDSPFPPTRFGAQVGPDDADLQAKVLASEGFVYLKVADHREGDLWAQEKIQAAIARIKSIKPIAVFCGFGVKSADDVRMLKNAGADGAFIGSQALHAQENGPDAFKSFWQAMGTAAGESAGSEE